LSQSSPAQRGSGKAVIRAEVGLGSLQPFLVEASDIGNIRFRGRAAQYASLYVAPVKAARFGIHRIIT
jgi:hypothetical protein